MKKIEAIIRPEKLHLLRGKLDLKGFSGMTVTEVKGRGRQKGIALQWRAGDYRVEFLQKIKLEMVVDDKDAETAIDIICECSSNGRSRGRQDLRLPGGGRGAGANERERVRGDLALAPLQF